MACTFEISTCIEASLPNVVWREDNLIPQPQLYYPTDKQNVCVRTDETITTNGQNTNVCLEWYRVANANKYLLQWSVNQNFDGPSIREEILDDPLTDINLFPTLSYCLFYPQDIRQDETIYWRVTAANLNDGTAGVSSPSETRELKFTCGDKNQTGAATGCDEYNVKQEIIGKDFAQLCDDLTYGVKISHTCPEVGDPKEIVTRKISWSFKSSQGEKTVVGETSLNPVTTTTVGPGATTTTTSTTLEPEEGTCPVNCTVGSKLEEVEDNIYSVRLKPAFVRPEQGRLCVTTTFGYNNNTEEFDCQQCKDILFDGENLQKHKFGYLPKGVEEIPAADGLDMACVSNVCLFKIYCTGDVLPEDFPTPTVSSLVPAIDENRGRMRITVHNPYDRPVTKSPFRVIEGADGTYIVAQSELSDTTTTTTTTTVGPTLLGVAEEILENPCYGRCRFTWSDSQQIWLPDTMNVFACSPTTTLEPTTTTTAEATTTTFCPCPEENYPTTLDPSVTTTVDPNATTTTTVEPTTTTTVEPCQCAEPTFCGTVDGQCAYTSCIRSEVELPPPPECGTTSTTTTSTPTTLNPDCPGPSCPDCPPECDPSTDCGDGCYWDSIPGGGFQLVDGGCFGACSCSQPSSSLHSLTDCVTLFTPCVAPGTPSCITSPCKGNCNYYSPKGSDDWYLISRTCGTSQSCGRFSCNCVPPSSPGDPCQVSSGVCVQIENPVTTTLDPCVDCWTTLTPPTTLTPTTLEPTTLDPCEQSCVVTANGPGWDIIENNCTGRCPCMIPVNPSTEATCETREIPCGNGTTEGPTTTTTTTTTTMAPPKIDCCLPDGSCVVDLYSVSECEDVGGTPGCVGCQAALGGCCVGSGTSSANCSDLTEVDCTAAGGNWYGANIFCNYIADNCRPPVNCCNIITGACTSNTVQCFGGDLIVSNCSQCTTTLEPTTTTSTLEPCSGTCTYTAVGPPTSSTLQWVHIGPDCSSGCECQPPPNPPNSASDPDVTTNCNPVI